MNNNEMFNFVGRCLVLDENPATRPEILAQFDQLDWFKFVGLCSNHLILPTIYLKFKSHDLISSVPDDLAEHLLGIYELNVVRNKEIIGQLREINTLLNKENIQPVFLKGAAYLLDGLYGDVGERILGDIDFLVPDKDYLVSAELLINAGYQTEAEFPGYKDIMDLKHYPRLEHPEYSATVEIHRIPVDEKYISWFDTTLIYREKREVPDIPGFFVPSDRHKIIHNFIHSQLVNEGDLFGIVSLREIYDLCLLSKRTTLMGAIREIKTRRKAIAYFAFSASILGLGKSFFIKRNLAFRVLSLKHELNQNSPLFYNSYRSFIFIGQRVFIGYIGQLFNALYSKEKRQYLSRRIKDRKWYGDHLKLYTRFFKNR